MSKCSSCKKEVKVGGVHLSGSDNDGYYCIDCYNEIIAEMYGMDYKREIFYPLIIKDAHGVNRTFYFETSLHPPYRSLQANERRDNIKYEDGYKFVVCGDLDCDTLDLYKQLVKKIQKALKRKHLNYNKRIDSVTLKEKVRGRITCATDIREPVILIDGRSFTWSEFGRMFLSYEGFQFRLEFVDITDEVK